MPPDWFRGIGVSEFPLPTQNAHAQRDSVLIGIGRFHGPLVIQKEFLPQRSADGTECARRLSQVEKIPEIGGGALVRKSKRTLRDAEVLLDKPENASEVVAFVVNIAHRRVGRDHHQRYAKAVLIIALTIRRHGQESWRLVIVPTSPVVPCNKDRRVLPIR